MRIQNNITAMNTHRQYTINNDNVAKAAEKLSSGYRINRAADDAAGLAISEKMRSQIRGLNMATKNSQDAISLVQTAEGALQETHSMLQRMNELAVQAATGTNQEFDRTQAAKEFEQLKREINDVAESTTFNNMKILDGSLSFQGYVRSAQTAGMTLSTSEADVEKGAIVPNSSSPYVAGTGTQESFTLTLSGKAYDGTSTDNADATITLTETGPTTPGTLQVSVKWTGTGTPGTDVLWTAANAADVEITAPTGYTASFSNGVITLTEDLAADGKAQGSTSGLTNYTSAVDAGGKGVAAASVGNFTAGVAGAMTTPEQSTAAVNAAKLQVGDTFKIGDYEFEIVEDADEALTTGKIGLTKANDEATLLNAIKGQTGVTTDYDIALTNGTLSVKQHSPQPEKDAAGAANAAYKSTAIEFTAASAAANPKYTNTIEFDTVKMKDGDAFSIKLGDNDPVTVKFEDVDKGSGETTRAHNMAEAFKTAITNAQITGYTVEAKGNALIIKGETKLTTDDIELSTDATQAAATKDNYKTNAMRIQVGALEDEQLNISIDSMNTAGLKLDGHDLFTQGNAGRAITATRDAINQVSDLRATLGAMQNRLDHKIANLKVSSENLSAAESRIRDVDMASEMTNFTKNNILSQAATAMLAQANALPQNVLSLLG